VYGSVVGTTVTSFAVVNNPMALQLSAGALGTNQLSYLKVMSDISPDTTLTAAAGITQYATTNQARLQTEYDSYRVLTAGLRVTVRYPMTSSPGRLFVLNPFESDQRLAGLTFNQVASLACSQPIVLDGSGVAIAEVRWRPSDLLDFEFLSTSSSYNFNSSKLVVIGIGWTANNFSLDIEAIAHHEYHSGALIASDSIDDQTVCLSTPMELLYPKVSRIPWFGNKCDIQNEDKAFRQAISRFGSTFSSSRVSVATAVTSRAPDALEDEFKEEGWSVTGRPSEKPYGMFAAMAGAGAATVAAHRALDRGAGNILRRIEGIGA
jgi:hypothetical protein